MSEEQKKICLLAKLNQHRPGKKGKKPAENTRFLSKRDEDKNWPQCFTATLVLDGNQYLRQEQVLDLRPQWFSSPNINMGNTSSHYRSHWDPRGFYFFTRQSLRNYITQTNHILPISHFLSLETSPAISPELRLNTELKRNTGEYNTVYSKSCLPWNISASKSKPM